jgi:uncharacterized repeat protein (TIGR01451 family)
MRMLRFALLFLAAGLLLPSLAAAAGPDLTVAATHAGPFAQGDTSAAGDAFTLTVSNVGDAPTSGTVTVVDRVHNGDGINYVSTTGSDAGWACAQSNAVVTCTRSDALAPGAAYGPIVINVSVNSTASLSPQDDAAVSGGGDPAGGAVTDPLTVAPRVDLVMHATLLNQLSFRQGDRGDGYQLTVYNQGAAPTTATVTVTATLPAGLTYNSVTASGWTCAFADPALTCTRSDALKGGAPPDGPGPYSAYPEIYLYVDVAPAAPATLTLATAVSGGGEQTSPTPQGNGTNTSNKATPITPVGDVNTTVAASGTPAQGGTVSYAITTHNTGAGATSGPITVTVSPGAGLTPTRLTGPGWTCDLASVSCTRATPVASGGTLDDITLAAAISRHAPATVTTAVTVAGGGELNAADDTTTFALAVAPSPDLEAALAVAGPFAQGDSAVDTVTLTSTNAGYAPTTGTRTAAVTLPRGFTAHAIAGTGWTCTLATVSCVRSDALAPAASDPPVVVTLDVAPDAPTDARFLARLSGGGELYDGNDSAIALAYIAQKPDLTVSIVPQGGFVAGGSGRYTVVVANAGLASTDGTPVTVTLTLPPELGLAALGGSGWTCTGASCTRSDVLAAGDAYPAISAFVDIARGASSVSTTAHVAGGGEVLTTDDDATAVTPVQPAPPPAAAVLVSAPPVFPAAVKPAAPKLAVRGGGVALSCAQRCTVTAKLVLSRASARRLHLTRRTARTLTRTLESATARPIALTLPASIRRAARRAHARTVTATLTVTVRYADGRHAKQAVALRIHI